MNEIPWRMSGSALSLILLVSSLSISILLTLGVTQQQDESRVLATAPSLAIYAPPSEKLSGQRHPLFHYLQDTLISNPQIPKVPIKKPEPVDEQRGGLAIVQFPLKDALPRPILRMLLID